MTIHQLRKTISAVIRESFENSGNGSLVLQAKNADLDADLLISDALEKDRTWILFNRNFEVDGNSEKKIRENAEKRATGLPVAYITHRKEFFGLEFHVDESVLIPKPDTETLVELAIEEIEKRGFGYAQPPYFGRARPSSGNARTRISICDMCCGSGCVGISILSRIRSAEMWFADVSEKALEVTKLNFSNLVENRKAEKVSARFVQSNLFSAFPEGQRFDVIATNPPYVPHREALSLLEDGRGEPLLALDGDVDEGGAFSGTDDGLSLIRRLVPQCRTRLNAGGALLMETGEYNATAAAELFRAAGFFDVRVERDLGGMPRVVTGRI